MICLPFPVFDDVLSLLSHFVCQSQQFEPFLVQWVNKIILVMSLSKESKGNKWKGYYDNTRKYKPEWVKRHPWVNRAEDGSENAFCSFCKVRLLSTLNWAILSSMKIQRNTRTWLVRPHQTEKLPWFQERKMRSWKKSSWSLLSQ